MKVQKHKPTIKICQIHKETSDHEQESEKENKPTKWDLYKLRILELLYMVYEINILYIFKEQTLILNNR